MIGATQSCFSTLSLALVEQRLGGTQGPDLTRYVLVCAGLLLLVAALAFAFRKSVGKALEKRAARRSLAVIDVLPLAGKQKLAVVRCYDRTFLLGLGTSDISLLSELDAAIEPRVENASSAADSHGFAQVLERIRSALPATRPAKEFIA